MSEFKYRRNIKLPKDASGKHCCIFYSCKCGCSTLKNFAVMNFYQEEHRKSGQNIWAFFDNPQSKDYVFDIFSDEEINNKEFKDAFKILVVRDPVDRLISFYKNKVCDDLYNEYYDEKKNVCYFRDCSFKEMVDRLYELVCKKGVKINEIGNVHLISQRYGIENIKIDLILRMEEMSKLTGLLNEKYDRKLKDSWVIGKSGVMNKNKWDKNVYYYEQKCWYFRDGKGKYMFPDHSFFLNDNIKKKIKMIFVDDY